jgi:hypothetical protein
MKSERFCEECNVAIDDIQADTSGRCEDCEEGLCETCEAPLGLQASGQCEDCEEDERESE